MINIVDSRELMVDRGEPHPPSPKGTGVQPPDATGGRSEMMGMLAEMAAETEQWRQAAGGASVAEIAAGWLAPQYLLALRGELEGLPDGPERLKLLRQAAGDVSALQLANIWAGRLRVEQEKLEFMRQKHR